MPPATAGGRQFQVVTAERRKLPPRHLGRDLGVFKAWLDGALRLVRLGRSGGGSNSLRCAGQFRVCILYETVVAGDLIF